MPLLTRLIHEIHRRSLWQVLLIYVGGALVAYEAVQALTEGLGLPDWFPGLAVVLFIVFLPIVLATAFVQEGVGRQASAEPASAEAAQQTEAFEPAEPASGTHHRIFTWRNAILALVGAFALLGVSVTGYMGMRLFGIGPVGSLVAKGVIEPGERIVLADFKNLTSDSVTALTVTEAVRTDLSQSRVVRLAEPEYLRRVLTRMERDPGSPLDETLAREVATREGLRAVIAGQVSQVGASYVLYARLVVPETGEAVAGWRETASDSDEVIDAIDQLSKKLRERVGESLKTIRSSPPLARVTTSSLEALQKYSQADRAFEIDGDEARSIALHEEAVALDTAFAMAYRRLGIRYRRVGQSARAVQAITKAFVHRDRLANRELYLVLGTYHDYVTGEREKAITAYRSLLEFYPDDGTALNNLALLLSAQRDYVGAAELFRRAIEADSAGGVDPYTSLVRELVAQGMFEEAQVTLERAAEQFPGHHQPEYTWVYLEQARGNYDAAEAHARTFREAHQESLRWREWSSRRLAYLAMLRGRLAAAENHLGDAIAENEQRGVPGPAVVNAVRLASLDVWFRGAADSGLLQVEEALGRHPLDSMEFGDRPYLDLIRFYALADRPDLARSRLTEYEEAVDLEQRRRVEPSLHAARGAVFLAEENPGEAIAELRDWDEAIGCPICALPDLSLAYELAGEPDSVIAISERYISTPYLYRVLEDYRALPFMYERLGRLYERRGDTAKAIYYHGKLVELWKDADPELQPRVEAARRAIEALRSDT